MNEERYAAQIAVLGRSAKAALDAEYAEAMGNHVAAAALPGITRQSLREIAQQGADALSATDLATASAWLRQLPRLVWSETSCVYRNYSSGLCTSIRDGDVKRFDHQ